VGDINKLIDQVCEQPVRVDTFWTGTRGVAIPPDSSYITFVPEKSHVLHRLH
jgi:hypothetical protein